MTGGLGFIGSAVVRRAIAQGHSVVTVDCETYAGNPANLASVIHSDRHAFEHVNICDRVELDRVFASHRPDAVMHLAAESHVDRSLDGPAAFIQTNLVGTFTLLEATRQYWRDQGQPASFRFHHVSTDEVFGSLGDRGRFGESSPYDPRSPYSASKAGSDHLVRAWHESYGLPVIVTNCSNNYGPFHHPEKLVPLTILNGLAGRPIPVYGDGGNIRDWLYVEDHAEALLLVLQEGVAGRTYNIGGNAEVRNIDLVRMICTHLDSVHPQAAPHDRLIRFVPDRPGHDRRYAIDPTRIRTELGWSPSTDLDTGLRLTVDWYLANRDWWQPLVSRSEFGMRLGANI